MHITMDTKDFIIQCIDRLSSSFVAIAIREATTVSLNIGEEVSFTKKDFQKIITEYEKFFGEPRNDRRVLFKIYDQMLSMIMLMQSKDKVKIKCTW